MNRRPAVLSLVLLLLAFAPASGSPAPVSGTPVAGAPASRPDRQLAIERLRALSSDRIEVLWNANRTGIRTLAGRLTPPRPGTAEGLARTFLLENQDLFGIPDDLQGLRLRGLRESPGGTHVGFDQEHAGLPVFDGGLEVHLDRSGAVTLVQSTYAERLDLGTSPRLTATAARRAAVQRVTAMPAAETDKRGVPVPGAATAIQPIGETALGILAWQAAPVLVYRVLLYSASPVALFETFVNARTGAIVLSRNLVQTATTGQGRVFDPNPVVTLGDPTLRDHDDAADAAFAPAYFNRPLPGVTRLFSDLLGPFTLSGPYVRIADLIEAPSNPMVTSPNAQFLFTRDQQGFEAVMAYLHIDRSQRYIQSLGFTDVNNRVLRADPHGLRGVDNSHYVPLPFGAGWVAFGEGGVDDAEDADVILHEYGHAIQDNQNPARFLPFGETGAMGEGFGDYWAFSNSPRNEGDPACIAEWDFEGTCLRRVDGGKHYPEDLEREVHADGEIWSALLHDVFGSLGKETADRIVLESHFLVPRAPDFCDGVHALKLAARGLYGDAEMAAVGEAAAARGIAGDFAFSPVVFDGRPPLRFAITNAGPCTAGPARHTILRVTPTGDVLAGLVETTDLAPGEIANFQFSPPGAQSGDVYKVVADGVQSEAETDETNNVLQFDSIPPPLFGGPPVIGSAEAVQTQAEAICDYTAVLQGFLCDNGFTAGMFQAPFPAETITARYTEARLRAGVTDPDSVPGLSDILLVVASYLVPGPGGAPQQVSIVLLDDGAAGVIPFGQEGSLPEKCENDPNAQVCSCTRASYAVTSHDASAADDLFTHGLSLAMFGAGSPGANAQAMMNNCIARADGLARPLGPFDQDLQFKFEAVDRAGNLTAWPALLPVTPEPGDVTCSGDECGCCLLMSTNPAADPAAGGCKGLSGLTGTPGSGFETGFCHIF
ncbi:MAG TPA: M36 family metallopeptidase [Verrucomicrobiae bacterium]|nr:M36 family metallopeptidase [Verrucomicrobiae bacterium]